MTKRPKPVLFFSYEIQTSATYIVGAATDTDKTDLARKKNIQYIIRLKFNRSPLSPSAGSETEQAYGQTDLSSLLLANSLYCVKKTHKKLSMQGGGKVLVGSVVGVKEFWDL